jgi:hypothetical protein
VKIEVLAVVDMKGCVFRDMELSAALRPTHVFGGTCRLHLQRTELVCSSEM